MWEMGGWCRRGEGGKRCGGMCACEGKALYCVVNTVNVLVGECGWSVLVEQGKGSGGVSEMKQGICVWLWEGATRCSSRGKDP